MDKKQQDFSWACLPKEAREKAKNYYKYAGVDSIEKEVLQDLFGHHNLTSDTEPEEMLMVERQRVQNMYDYNDDILLTDPTHKGAKLLAAKLKELFGDKCLPDKETEYSKQRFRVHDKVMFNDNLCQIIGTDYDNKEFQLKRISDNHLMGWANESALEPYVKQPSVQVEPKFKVGELAMNYGKKCRILDYNPDGKFPYLIHILYNNLKTNVSEFDLEPYTEPSKVEPKFHKGDKVKIADEKVSTFGNIATITHCEVDEGKVFYWLNDDIGYYSEHQLEPYTEPETKDNMEEKELNLVELLKGCEGEEFYSSAFGNIRLEEIQVNNLVFKEENNKVVDELFQTDSEGVHSINGMTIIFPSRALYEKYPLDAYSAWMEWKEARKPKRWRAEKGEEYWFLSSLYKPMYSYDEYGCDEDWLYESGNYFRTKEEAQQAAEAVRECLRKFHEKNCKQ